MKPVYVALAVVLGALAFFLPPGFSYGQRVVSGMIAFVAALWLSEALPISASALLVPVILAVSGVMAPKEAFAPLFDPIIALMFGGFAIARAVGKCGLDSYLADRMVQAFPKTKAGLLLAMVLTATFLSFFVANTIVAILLIPVGIGLASKDSKYAKAMVLGIAFAASIGGTGLIIGTTPNAITVGLLENKGYPVGFLEWSLYCVPLAVVMGLVCWWVVGKSFGIGDDGVVVKPVARGMDGVQKRVLVMTGVILLLWFTSVLPEPLGVRGHGIDSGVISVLGVVLFMALGLLDEKDVSSLDWATLLLLGCGIALGVSVGHVGLDSMISGVLSGLISAYPYLTYGILVCAAALMTVFASNTGTAALLAPIVIAVGLDTGINVKLAAIAAAVATSTDFLLPTGTPPNAIAYGTRVVSLREMFSVGSRLMVAVIPMIVAYFMLLDAFL